MQLVRGGRRGVKMAIPPEKGKTKNSEKLGRKEENKSKQTEAKI